VRAQGFAVAGRAVHARGRAPPGERWSCVQRLEDLLHLRARAAWGFERSFHLRSATVAGLAVRARFRGGGRFDTLRFRRSFSVRSFSSSRASSSALAASPAATLASSCASFSCAPSASASARAAACSAPCAARAAASSCVPTRGVSSTHGGWAGGVAARLRAKTRHTACPISTG